MDALRAYVSKIHKNVMSVGDRSC